MVKEVLMFADIEIEKHKLYRYKSFIFSENVDNKDEFVSSKTYFSEQYYKSFISYLYDQDEIKPMHTMLPKATAYVKVIMAKLNRCSC